MRAVEVRRLLLASFTNTQQLAPWLDALEEAGTRLSGVYSVPLLAPALAAKLGVRGARFVFQVLVPAAAPMIFTGLRLSLQASWTTLVAAELVGALLGLGQVLNAAAQDLFPAMILTGMVFVALSGAASTWLLGRIEQRVMRWRAA